LRLVLLGTPACEHVCELLHGIPTLEFEEYLRDLEAAAPGAPAQVFVPQVPGLSLYGALARTEARDSRFAVNAAVDLFFTTLTAGATVEAWLAREWRHLTARGVRDDALIIAFAGSGGIENESFDGGIFAAEQALLTRACGTLSRARARYIVLYAPHPMYDAATFEASPMLRGRNAIVCRPSILTWLLADAILGTHSSSLYEAAFAGAAAFTPLKPADALYPPSLLNALSHPHDGESRADALDAFLLGLGSGREDVMQRAMARAARLTSRAAAAATATL
jgi:hypothetical protein